MNTSGTEPGYVIDARTTSVTAGTDLADGGAVDGLARLRTADIKVLR